MNTTLIRNIHSIEKTVLNGIMNDAYGISGSYRGSFGFHVGSTIGTNRSKVLNLTCRISA